MVKKRRLALGSVLSPSSSKMRCDGRGDDVMVARDRLKGALQDLFNSDDSSSSSQEESKSVEVKKEVKPRLIRRRRRKMALDLELAFQHTFVMKLFDRSVDLAQFKEGTPLYPICRAWIANQPRVPLPYPPLETEIKNEEETSSLEFDSGELRDVYKLPPPSCPAWTNRIPPITPLSLQGITLDYSSENLPTANDLLKDHILRWRNTRQKWTAAAQTNEARFQASGKILCNIFKRAQNASST